MQEKGAKNFEQVSGFPLGETHLGNKNTILLQQSVQSTQPGYKPIHSITSNPRLQMLIQMEKVNSKGFSPLIDP